MLRPLIALVTVMGISAFAPDRVTTSAFSLFEGPADCYNCDSNACLLSNEHKQVAGGSKNGPPHSCQAYSDPCPHADCIQPSAAATMDSSELETRSWELAGLVERATQGDGEAIAFLVQRFPESLVINFKRSALQVRGCTAGTLAAHIPVSGRQLAAIAETMESRNNEATELAHR